MTVPRNRAVNITIATIAASLLLSAACLAMFAFSLMGVFNRLGNEAAAAEPPLSLAICAAEGGETPAGTGACDF